MFFIPMFSSMIVLSTIGILYLSILAYPRAQISFLTVSNDGSPYVTYGSISFKADNVALLARTNTALLTYLSLNKLRIARLFGEIFLRPLIRITKSNFGSAGMTKLPYFSYSAIIAAFSYSAF